MKSKLNISSIQDARNIKGVYCLYNKNKEIEYIGQSSNIYTRILEHLVEDIKEISYFKYIKIEDSDIRELIEVFLISNISQLFPLKNKLILDMDNRHFMMYLPYSIREKLNSSEEYKLLQTYQDFFQSKDNLNTRLLREFETSGESSMERILEMIGDK